MLCENCSIDRTDNLKEFRKEQRVDFLISACHGLLPYLHRLANATHCTILRDKQVGSRDDRNPFLFSSSSCGNLYTGTLSFLEA